MRKTFLLLYSVASTTLLVCGAVLYRRKRKRRRRMVFDIEHAARIVESSTAAALQRMRQANEKLEKAQRATQNRETQLAEALEEYNRCVAEVVDYLNIASRHRSRANKGG
jgi:ABC-type transporter Mla subunit MlaD